MRLLFKGIILFGLVLGLFSCIEDVDDFSNSYEEKLVVHSLISPKDSILSVSVQKTIPIYNSNNILFDFVADADVYLTSGTDSLTLTYNATVNEYQGLGSAFNITPNQTYQISVITKEHSVTSECVIPKEINIINNLDPILELKKNADGNIFTYFNIDLTWDQSNAVGTVFSTVKYSIYAYQNGVETHINNKSNLREITYSDNDYPQLFTDNNLTTEFSFYTVSAISPSVQKDSIRVRIEEIKHVLLSSETHYERYFKSLSNQNSAAGSDLTGGNPFKEPVVMYSNIKDGAGVFGAYTYDTIVNVINEDFIFVK